MKFTVKLNEVLGKWEGVDVDASFCDDGLRSFVNIPPGLTSMTFEMFFKKDEDPKSFEMFLNRKITRVVLTRGNNFITLGKLMGRYLSSTLNINKNSQVPVYVKVTGNGQTLTFF